MARDRYSGLHATTCQLEMMLLHETGPQLKLPPNATKGSMPLQCNTYFPKILAIESIGTHINFNLPLMMKGWTDFHLINDISRAFRKENADVVGDKPVKNDAGEMSMDDDSKGKAWLEHYQRLLNAEFDWDPNHLSDESPVEGPPIPITVDMVKKAISQMKADKALGP